MKAVRWVSWQAHGRENRLLWVEIDFVLGRRNNSKVNSIADQDRIREEIMLRLPSDQFHIWLSVGFTGDRKWAL